MGVDGERAHLRLIRQAVGYAPPAVIPVRQPHQAAFADAVALSGQADIDVGLMVLVRHVTPPNLSFLAMFKSAISSGMRHEKR